MVKLLSLFLKLENGDLVREKSLWSCVPWCSSCRLSKGQKKPGDGWIHISFHIVMLSKFYTLNCPCSFKKKNQHRPVIKTGTGLWV